LSDIEKKLKKILNRSSWVKNTKKEEWCSNGIKNEIDLQVNEKNAYGSVAQSQKRFAKISTGITFEDTISSRS